MGDVWSPRSERSSLPPKGAARLGRRVWTPPERASHASPQGGRRPRGGPSVAVAGAVVLFWGLAEAARRLGLRDTQIVVNVQGDEPLIPPQTVVLSQANHPERRLQVGTDGLRPFAVLGAP